MPCTMSISSVTGTVVSGNLVSIQVTGTCTGCDKVEVTLRCAGGFVQQSAMNLGGWTVIFSGAALQKAGCRCQQLITVSATCVVPNDPSCHATLQLQQLPCTPPCCSVQLSAAIDTACSSGKRRVTLDVLNQCPGLLCAQWDFGDGSPLVTFSVASGATQSVSHFYPPGTYTAVLHVPGCADKNITFTAPSCCPTVSFQVAPGACNSDGTQPVGVTAVVTPPFGSGLVQAELVEGSTVLASGTSSSSALTLTHSGNFAGGSHTLCVRFVQPAGCADQCTTFTVDCTGACCLPDGSCRHGQTQEECQHLSGTFMGFGTDCSTIKCPPPADPDRCQKTFRKWFCPLLFAIMTFGSAIGLALLLLATCAGALAGFSNTLVTTGTVTLAVGVVALILYWILCTKCLCGWFYLFLWRVLFGVGMILSVFGACCSSLQLAGIGMILLGLFFLYLWKTHCKKTLCELLAELILVMAVYILPIISFVLGLGTLTTCLWVLFSFNSFHFTFLLLVSVAFAAVVVYEHNHC